MDDPQVFSCSALLRVGIVHGVYACNAFNCKMSILVCMHHVHAPMCISNGAFLYPYTDKFITCHHEP